MAQDATVDTALAKRIARWRRTETVTPGWWDRDCRVCLELWRHDGTEQAYHTRTGRTSYHCRGGDTVIIITGHQIEEEVHSDHSDGEIATFVHAMEKAGRM